jgi:hypothetical protein
MPGMLLFDYLLHVVNYENLSHMAKHVWLINHNKLHPYGFHFYVKDPVDILKYITQLRIAYGKAYQELLISRAVHFFRNRIGNHKIPGVTKLKKELINGKWMNTYEIELTFIALIARITVPKRAFKK